MHTLATTFVLAYHGCDSSVAEKLLAGKDFKKSTNAYDWLGHGIDFWEANPVRGLDFAKELKRRPRGPSKIKRPAVIGAVIDLGLCLDLMTSTGVDQVRIAHKHLKDIADKAGFQLPKNSSDGLRRNLDCAVIQTLHDIRRNSGQPPIDTVRGVFIEGDRIYQSSGFYEKTHTQVCVCNSDCIKGVFRVPKRHLKLLGGT